MDGVTLGMLSLIQESGISLTTNGAQINLHKKAGENPNLEVVKAWITGQKPWLIQAMQDPDVIRQVLSGAQEHIGFMRDQLLHEIDQFDKAEELYRALHPTANCVSGGKCSDDMVVRCMRCASPNVSVIGEGGRLGW
jgi:hypothetical protein